MVIDTKPPPEPNGYGVVYQRERKTKMEETQRTPSATYRPDLDLITKDIGDKGIIKQWCASYGDFNAWGDSPAEAMAAFDEVWTAKLN